MDNCKDFYAFDDSGVLVRVVPKEGGEQGVVVGVVVVGAADVDGRKIAAPQHVVDAEVHRVQIVGVHISEAYGGIYLPEVLLFEQS